MIFLCGFVVVFLFVIFLVSFLQVHEATVERNAYPSPLNYYLFPKSLVGYFFILSSVHFLHNFNIYFVVVQCTSVNEVICHGIPDMRPLEDGDIVNLDISVYFGGYHADLNETFLVNNKITFYIDHVYDLCGF